MKTDIPKLHVDKPEIRVNIEDTPMAATMKAIHMMNPVNFSMGWMPEKAPLQEQAEQLEAIAAVLEKQAAEQKRQADIQTQIHAELQAEEVSRSKDDRKYFWWGVATSFVVSMLVEHGAELITLLQELLQP